MKKYYVYRHIREDKMETFYVGIGTRSTQDLKCNTYGRAYAFHRDNIIWIRIVAKTKAAVQILFEYDTRKEAQDKEVELILQYGRKCDNTGTLANLTLGGEFNKGYKHSIEAKLKISKKARRKRGYSNVVYDKNLREKLSTIHKERANRPEQIEYRRKLAKGNTYHLVHKHSDESKAKMSQAAKNRPTNAITIKCKLIDVINNIEWKADTIRDLAKLVPISLSTLNRLSQGIPISKKYANQYKFYKE